MIEGQSALGDVRVLDLSNLIAGPMCTMYLADFGADVVKVEHPVKGDEMRLWGHAKDDVGLFFKMINRNKRLVTIDLKAPRGRRLALDLVAESDVVVESFRPGTLERWGLGYDDLQTVNRDLVQLSITGFGQSGPHAERAGFGTVAEGFSGAAHITGHADGPPLLPAFGLADAATAVYGAFAILLALHALRLEGGTGQRIDLALYEGLFTMIGPHAIDFDQLGKVQMRDGSRLPFVAPRNTYRTRDNAWIALAGSTQATFERAMQALGRPDVADDPRFASNRSRLENVDALDEVVQEAVGRFDKKEALHRLTTAGAVAGPVHSIADIFADEHYQARENITAVPDPELGTVRMQNVVPKLERTPGRIRHGGLRKGEHNHEVFAQLLGMDESHLADLRGHRVI